MTATLVVGLLNNMPDTALRQTEAQFAALLQAAIPHVTVRLDLFALSTIPRSSFAQSAVAARYRAASQIAYAGLDALIVTGMEPGTGLLQDLPCWSELGACIDAAARRAIPTLWSCLAAHAAVLRLDGVSRQRLPRKLSGVYQCREGAGTRTWRCAHSRHNEVSEGALLNNEYRIVARLADQGIGRADAGVDAFVHASLPFLYLQGHPEYHPATLPREYARDLQRHLADGGSVVPSPPAGAFAPHIEQQLRDAAPRAAVDLLRDATPLPFAAPAPHSPAMRWLAALASPAAAPAVAVHA